MASKSLKDYQRKRLPAVTVSALNRTLRGAVTDTKRVMAKKIAMTQANVGRGLIPRKAIKGHPIASITVRGERRVPNLSRFQRVRQTKKGVSAKVWEKQKTYKGTWLLERDSGSNTVFKTMKSKDKVVPSKGSYYGRTIKRGPRKGQKLKRRPIEPVFGTSLRRAFLQQPNSGRSAKTILKPMIEARWRTEFARQLGRLR